MGSLQKERCLRLFLQSFQKCKLSVWHLFTCIIYFGPHRSLRLSNPCVAYLSQILGGSLASSLLSVMCSHCQMALSKLIFLGLHLLEHYLCCVPYSLLFSLCHFPCLYSVLSRFSSLWSPSFHLFPFDLPTQSIAGGQLTPFTRCFLCAKPWWGGVGVGCYVRCI